MIFEITAQPDPGGIVFLRQVKDDETPTPVPASSPTRLWIPPAQRCHPADLGQTINPLDRPQLGFDKLPVFQPPNLAQETSPIGPAFERFEHFLVARSPQCFGTPKQHVEELLLTEVHWDTEAETPTAVDKRPAAEQDRS